MAENASKNKTHTSNARGINMEILGLLVLGGGIITVLSLSPALLVAAVPVARGLQGKYSNKQLQNAFGNLKQRGLITAKKTENGKTFTLTAKGRRRAEQNIFSQKFKAIRSDEKWDGLWRIVLFDVPHYKKKQRDTLRYALKRLGFEQFQKSAWILPYPCEKELQSVKENLNLSDLECRIIIASDVGDEGLLKKLFELS